MRLGSTCSAVNGMLADPAYCLCVCKHAWPWCMHDLSSFRIKLRGLCKSNCRSAHCQLYRTLQQACLYHDVSAAFCKFCACSKTGQTAVAEVCCNWAEISGSLAPGSALSMLAWCMSQFGRSNFLLSVPRNQKSTGLPAFLGAPELGWLQLPFAVRLHLVA